jgi:outer membrane protein assembly factor BamB
LKNISAFCRTLVLLTGIIALSIGCGTGGAPAATNSSADWPMFRQNPEHTGVAPSSIVLPLTLKWDVQAGDTLLSSPAISNGRLYVGSFAFDAATGKKLWNFDTAGPVTTSPAVSGNRLFVGSYEMKISARDTGSGKELWGYLTND